VREEFRGKGIGQKPCWLRRLPLLYVKATGAFAGSADWNQPAIDFYMNWAQLFWMTGRKFVSTERRLAAAGGECGELSTVRIIGAGLAGSEAAWQCARRGVAVE